MSPVATLRPQRRLSLHALLDGFADAPAFDAEVTGLSADSRELQAGDAFVALAGATTHGLRFAGTAQAAGVAAILFEPPAPAGSSLPDTAVAVEGLRGKLGRIADRFYGAPSRALAMTGVTGTNGKTSTVQLIAQALSLHGDRVGTIGTLGAGLYGEHLPGERTTPDVIAVHRLLAHLRDQGATRVAMEVSSHALEQGRVDEVAFRVAVFTNLTRDHLDYHGSMESYGEAKAKLFAWPTLQAAVVNLDDAFGAGLIERTAPGVRRIGVSSRGHADASLQARAPRLSPVDGRMSRVGGKHGQPLVVVDYAHTPDALEQALASLREHTPGHLTCVFGCGGDRDRGKRPQMAAIAEAGADRVIVTDDNPRSEDGDAIVADIVRGFVRPDAARVQRDRAAAIALALQDAGPRDIVLVAGKGHEAYQEVAGRKFAFDDLAVARSLLESKA